MKSEQMEMRPKKRPSYGLIKLAISPGDHVYVLDENNEFVPRKVIAITRTSLLTEIGELLFDDHGWLWRCLP